MKNITPLILIGLMIMANAELIVNDLTLEGGHTYCLYNQTGEYNDCYAENRPNIPANVNYTMYIQSSGLDSLLSIDIAATSLWTILPLIIFTVFGGMIIIACFTSVYIFLRG